MQHWQQPGVPGTFSADVRAADSERTFFMSVFGWMAAALALTGTAAFVTAGSIELLTLVYSNIWFFIIPMFVLAFVMPSRAARMPIAVSGLLFAFFSVIMGMLLSGIFLTYELGSVFEVFVLTAGIFGGMAFYGLTTKRDLTGWGSFLMMGLVGVVIAGVINIFWRNDMFAFVKACVGVIVFTGFTAYDTQRLRGMHAEVSGTTAVGALAIVGAFTLYLNFINLFIKLLQLFGRRR